MQGKKRKLTQREKEAVRLEKLAEREAAKAARQAEREAQKAAERLVKEEQRLKREAVRFSFSSLLSPLPAPLALLALACVLTPQARCGSPHRDRVSSGEGGAPSQEGGGEGGGAGAQGGAQG